jgi:plasmid stabilization system protein ParE
VAQLRITPRAREDLLEIWSYIADDSEANADGFIDKIYDTMELLAGQTGLGGRGGRGGRPRGTAEGGRGGPRGPRGTAEGDGRGGPRGAEGAEGAEGDGRGGRPRGTDGMFPEQFVTTPSHQTPHAPATASIHRTFPSHIRMIK